MVKPLSKSSGTKSPTYLVSTLSAPLFGYSSLRIADLLSSMLNPSAFNSPASPIIPLVTGTSSLDFDKSSLLATSFFRTHQLLLIWNHHILRILNRLVLRGRVHHHLSPRPNMSLLQLLLRSHHSFQIWPFRHPKRKLNLADLLETPNSSIIMLSTMVPRVKQEKSLPQTPQ